MKFVLIYLVLINAYAFLFMLIDKRKAIKNKWRIPEKHLLGVCAIGGSFGGLLGMYTFRHKTKHPLFTIGIPVMLIMNVICLVLLFDKLIF